MAKSNTDTAGPERSEKYLLGEKMVVEFLGKPYQLGKSNIFSETLREYTFEHTLSSYARPGLTFRERNLLNIALFIATNREHELRINLLSTEHNGLSKEDTCEAIRHCMLYTGMAAGRDAFLVASELLGD
ncbi:uncharacterized protein A1O9_06243 [Exophiala aquamarina CBS 119918]|uniref:Carboxymuconolactone decarboxylase-like domain-containing protein n=1 Tax=Exophiala aquamarina CBS 119918 TaxID=1182545 RepID=A0A072PF07_9EURO|nr:uncharacterized protein A1O9_06243 [Exophiala aquamarina CBS 119918]KEF58317.1 hypothetical protein A1O9_06243 [Exophiala aquamarina CBS 119918]